MPQKPVISSANMEALLGMLVSGSTWANTSGRGPSPRTASAYMPRVQPSIRPFMVPMQEMAMNKLSMLPSTLPNMLVKAVVAPSAIRVSTVAPPATPT